MLPVPLTVSPELAAVIARPPDPAFNVVPPTIAAWKERIARSAAIVAAQLPALRSELGVESQPDVIAGVKVFRLTPRAVTAANQSRILLHFHGGTRVLFPGESGTREGILMAGLAGFRVISVDYRMPPDHPFPATLDDAVAVYGALLKDYPAANIGVFGMSAGGSLTITTLLRAKQLGLPMPGAIAPGTPTVDLTKTGDTLFTNAMVDNVLGTWDGYVEATTRLYANGREVTDPLISPIYGDVSGFPPALLTSGTRDLYLSHTVRMHRKLRAAGVEAVLQLWEGQSHAQYLAGPSVPETREYHAEAAAFLDRHLAR